MNNKLVVAAKVVIILLLVLIVVHDLKNAVTTKTIIIPCSKTTKKHKRVNFNSHVRIIDAGGKKKDRFNPDLKHCIQTNVKLAATVGGSKNLAALSLKEAAAE